MNARVKQPAASVIWLVALLAVATIDGFGCAQPAVTNQMMAERVVELLGLKQIMRTVLNECKASPPAPSVDPTQIVVSSPSEFGGITPESHYWAEIERAYKDYRDEYCDAQFPPEANAALVDIYAVKLSADELSEGVAFYGSPAGRAFVKAHIEANRVLTQVPRAQAADVMKRSEDEFHEQMDAVYKKWFDERGKQGTARGQR